MGSAHGRRLICTRCGDPVRVLGASASIDPRLYVCSLCLEPVEPEPEQRQLALVEREETRSYDPAISEIPF